MIFPDLEPKISQIICQKNTPLTLIVVFFSLKRCTGYFPVSNQKYRSLQCTWSSAYDYSWYLITANITRERLMLLVLFLLFLLYLSIWHYMYTDKKSQFVWFWRYFSQLNGYRYQYQWVEKNHWLYNYIPQTFFIMNKDKTFRVDHPVLQVVWGPWVWIG